VAEALVDIFSRLGIPEEILSDLGTQFVSDCMKEVTRLLSIKQLTTTPYHPMCNGLTFAYREVPRESTGVSPFELLYGRAVRGPMFILKKLWTKDVEVPEAKNSYQYVFELREKLEDTLNIARSELQKAQQKGKHYYDRKAKVRKFQEGDKVLVLLPTDHNKLLMQWKGLFEVSAVVGLNDYKVKVKGKDKVYHANLLEKYFERDEPTEESAVTTKPSAAVTREEDDKYEPDIKAQEGVGDFLEIGGYVAMELVADASIGPNLTDEQRAEFLELAHQFSSQFTEAPGTTGNASMLDPPSVPNF